MKFLRIPLAMLILVTAISASAQLINTKWVGTFAIPSEADCYLQFKSDTLHMILAENDNVIEVMKYVVKTDTVILTKISGGSPCEDSNIGTYKWKIEGNKLTMTVITDDCPARSGAFVTGELTRVVEAGAMKKE